MGRCGRWWHGLGSCTCIHPNMHRLQFNIFAKLCSNGARRCTVRICHWQMIAVRGLPGLTACLSLPVTRLAATTHQHIRAMSGIG